MTTEALGQATATEDRRAWYGQLALDALRRAGGVLGRVVRGRAPRRLGASRRRRRAVDRRAVARLVGADGRGGRASPSCSLLCLLFLIGRTAYDVSLDLNRTRVVVGERAVGALTLANTGSPRHPALARAAAGRRRARRLRGAAARGGRVRGGALRHPDVSAARVVKVGPVSVVRGDPLGLFERVHRRDEPVDLFVHPRTVLFDGQSLGFLRDLEGLPAHRPLARRRVVPRPARVPAGRRPAPRALEVDRPHRPRHGAPVRGDAPLALRDRPVDEPRATTATTTEFELAISAAGSLGLRALRDSHRVEVRVQERALPAGNGQAVPRLALGARALASRARATVVDLAGVVAATLPLASVVVLVCGSTRRRRTTLRSACSRLPYGARVLAVVATPGAAAPSLRRIGEADVVTLGALDQLPGALRKVLA